MTTQSYTHYDPRNRLHPSNAQTSIMHTFEVAFDDKADVEALFSFLDSQSDIWLDRGLGLNKDGSVGSTPTPVGRLAFFQVQTPRNDLAMLFKLTFGGAA